MTRDRAEPTIRPIEVGRPFRLMSAGVAGRPVVGCDLFHSPWRRVKRRRFSAPSACASCRRGAGGGGHCERCGRGWRRRASGRRTRRDAAMAERLLPIVRVIDAVHPLFGQSLEISPRGLIWRIGWIRVVLSDGRHRWVPQKATDLNVSACEARPNCDLPLVSVRTLIPLAEYVRARLSALGERFDETSGHTADPAVRAGIAGSTADLGAEIVADDDADSTTTASEAGGAATPVNACRSRRRRFNRGASQ
jgi:hypothetical protein